MALGAMQPYLFPYLGYFQLMNCVDTYLFCGNLQYIKRGWVNRNRIFINAKSNEIHYFTFSIAKDDYKKNINQRYYSNLKEDCEKLKRHLYQNYRRAINFEEAYHIIEEILQFHNDNVAFFNMNASYKIARYLGIKTRITCTDLVDDPFFLNKFYELDYENRVIYMCHYFNEKSYINAIGGASLYHKNIFADNHIDLKFIRMDDITYPQFRDNFVPNLSIIDVIMYNKIETVKMMLERYQIV